MMNCKIDPRIEKFMLQVEADEPRANEEQKALVKHVRRCFETEDIYTDTAQLDKYLSLAKYFPYGELFPWEVFILGLWDCTYWQGTNEPRWDTVFCMIGRGAGKDGFIAFDGMCSISPYNPVANYNVDICANNEEQALRPQQDLIEVLETPTHEKILTKHFYHTKEVIQGRKNKGIMKGHTNNPKGRDGLRPGKIIFNEVHGYENYDNIDVFTSALGKRAQARTGFFTSNGYVQDGPLDDYLERGRDILFNGKPDGGFLPLICCIKEKEQIHDPLNWAMANPSLPYLPSLQKVIDKQYKDWLDHPEQNGDLLTKRFGLRVGSRDLAVTDYEKVKATNKPIPDMRRWFCTVGIDYAELRDWAAVNFHFRMGDKRYDINHAWLCLRNKDLKRIKAPWQKWAEDGLLTPVDDVGIHPDLLAAYIAEMARVYRIKGMALDSWRYQLVSQSLRKIGFDCKDKNNIYLVRPSDISKVEPTIQECFNRDLFHWGDNPMLRWAVNNTKRVKTGVKNKTGIDTGNFVYSKIEPKSRKNDPFMALVASMAIEDKLPTIAAGRPKIGAVTL